MEQLLTHFRQASTQLLLNILPTETIHGNFQRTQVLLHLFPTKKIFFTKIYL